MCHGFVLHARKKIAIEKTNVNKAGESAWEPSTEIGMRFFILGMHFASRFILLGIIEITSAYQNISKFKQNSNNIERKMNEKKMKKI